VRLRLLWGNHMFKDQKARFRSYETIVERVLIERNKLGIDHLCCMRFREVFRRYFTESLVDESKPRIVIQERCAVPFLNRETFTVHVSRGLWDEAGLGEPFACFQLLHELGHVLLHRHPTHGFTTAKQSLLRIAQNEESCEWQANVFAATFMAPPYLAPECEDRHSFSTRFNFPSEFVDFWFDLKSRRPLIFTDIFCSECGCQRIVKLGRHYRCVHCGNFYQC
jgi:hypothetical protein